MSNPSDVVKLDASGRLPIPAEVLKALGWPRAEGQVSLVAEWIDAGILRLHRETDVHEKIVALEQQLQAATSDDVVRALYDRYRVVAFYPKEARVRLTRVVIAALIGTVSPEQLVYVEHGENSIMLFSHEARLQRLRKLAIETAI